MSLWANIAIWLAQMVKDLADKTRPSSISGLHPAFEAKVDALIIAARAHGMDVGLFEGFRTWERQGQLYAQGRSTPGKVVTKAQPGFSWHNFGLAADLVFRVNGKWSWAEGHPWSKLGALGKEIGLKWGGDFKNSKGLPFPDRPHFEWPTKMTLASARSLYRAGGINSVWKNLN